MTTTELTITARQVDRLRDHLLQTDDLERIAFLNCSYSNNRLLVEEIVPIEDDQYETRHEAGCRPTLPVERNRIQECINRGMHPVIVHSHPFHDDESVPGFSCHDRELMDGLHRMVTGLDPDTTVGFGVLGQHGINTRVYDSDEDQPNTLPVTVRGDWLLNTPLVTPRPTRATRRSTRTGTIATSVPSPPAANSNWPRHTSVSLASAGSVPSRRKSSPGTASANSPSSTRTSSRRATYRDCSARMTTISTGRRSRS
jgi:hypothetical protein